MDGLERSLGEAFEKDAKRKAEDDMKKRAIVTARSYDEFRHLVAAAQQKPLDRGDLDKKMELVPNRAVGAAAGRGSTLGFDLGLGLPAAAQAAAAAASSSATVAPALAGPLPSTPGEVDREWRRLPKDIASRARYLARLGPARLSSVFAADLDPDLLGHMLRALAGGAAAMTAGDGVEEQCAGVPGALRLALALSTSPGFPLALDMLGEEDVGAVRALRDGAAKAAAGDAGLQALVEEVTAKYQL